MASISRLLFAACFLSIAVPGSAADYNRAPDYRPFSGYTLIQAGTLLAVPGEAPAAGQTVVVRNGRVVAIEDGWIEQVLGGDEAPAKVLDLRDRFVMPGFIDLHVHLLSQSGGDRKGQFVERGDSYFALQGSQFARWTLEAGFTTVRDPRRPRRSDFRVAGRRSRRACSRSAHPGGRPGHHAQRRPR